MSRIKTAKFIKPETRLLMTNTLIRKLFMFKTRYHFIFLLLSSFRGSCALGGMVHTRSLKRLIIDRSQFYILRPKIPSRWMGIDWNYTLVKKDHHLPMIKSCNFLRHQQLTSWKRELSPAEEVKLSTCWEATQPYFRFCIYFLPYYFFVRVFTLFWFLHLLFTLLLFLYLFLPYFVFCIYS